MPISKYVFMYIYYHTVVSWTYFNIYMCSEAYAVNVDDEETFILYFTEKEVFHRFLYTNTED